MLVINFEIFVLVVKKISSKLLPSKKSTKTSPSVTRGPSLRRGKNKNNVNLTRMNRTSPTLRLAKATLTLIPVMGMQNLIFILIPSQGKWDSCRIDLLSLKRRVWTWFQGVNNKTREIRNLVEHSLEAYAGILVASIYCFLNHEVQVEISRYAANTKMRFEII